MCAVYVLVKIGVDSVVVYVHWHNILRCINAIHTAC